MTAAEIATLVSDALADLAARAGCAPADASPGAVGRVRAVLRADGARGGRADPSGCPVWVWVRQRTGVPFVPLGEPGTGPKLLVTTRMAVVVGPRVGWTAPDRVILRLPACVAGAVALVDTYAGAAETPDLYTEAA